MNFVVLLMHCTIYDKMHVFTQAVASEVMGCINKNLILNIMCSIYAVPDLENYSLVEKDLIQGTCG